jgi:hypothetical protein
MMRIIALASLLALLAVGASVDAALVVEPKEVQRLAVPLSTKPQVVEVPFVVVGPAAAVAYAKVLPVPGNPAFLNQSGNSGWSSGFAIQQDGKWRSVGTTNGSSLVLLGPLDQAGRIAGRLELKVPPQAVARGVTVRVNYALAVQSVGSTNSSGGSYDPSKPLILELTGTEPAKAKSRLGQMVPGFESSLVAVALAVAATSVAWDRTKRL